MINIITSKQLIADSKYIEFPWQIFNIATSMLYQSGDSSEIEKIIHEVEGCETLDSQLFKSKFNGVPLKLSSLSTGSQVIICIYYLIKTNQANNKIIDITDCGNNAIKYILNHYNKYDLSLYLGHKDLYKDEKYSYLLNNEPADHLYTILESEVKDEKYQV